MCTVPEGEELTPEQQAALAAKAGLTPPSKDSSPVGPSDGAASEDVKKEVRAPRSPAPASTPTPASACTSTDPHHTTLSLSRDYLLTPLSLPHTGNGCRVRQGWDLGSDAIFKDMKSVITKSGKETKKGKDEAKKAAKAEEAAAKKEKAEPKAKGGKKGKAAAEAEAAPAEEEEAPKNGRSRRKTAGNAKSKDMPPPAVPGSDARSALYSEIDLAMYRPPSVITPEESDLEARTRSGITPGAITGGSANAISPGTMMYALLGTPTPQLPSCSGVAGSMLSPGTLNELGNMLQSPAPPTTSKRRRGADQGETSKASPS